jgi:hypothetical protein
VVVVAGEAGGVTSFFFGLLFKTTELTRDANLSEEVDSEESIN